MCFRRKKVEPVQEPVVEEVPEVKEPKFWTANCPKCGAMLNLKEGAFAYMCPVCNSVLQMKTTSRLVRQIEPEVKAEENAETAELAQVQE